MQPAPEVSIVIVSYNCLEPLRACLDSIKADSGPTTETIVIDNDSRDGTAAFLHSQDFKAIFPKINIGFGAGANLGAASAKGRYLFFLNPDTELPAGTLDCILGFARENPDFGLISALLVDMQGRVQISAREFPDRKDFLFGRGSLLFKLGLTGERKAGYISDIGDQPRKVPAVSGTALFVERDVFDKLGGFDERFFMYLEDIDLCRRIAAQGRPIWVLPSARVLHRWRKSTSTRPYFMAYHHHLSVFKYFYKYESRNWFLNVPLAIALMTGFVVTSVLKIFGKRGAV